MFQHEFINGEVSRTLPQQIGGLANQVLGEYDDDHFFTGGPLSASGEISVAEFTAFPTVYVTGATWLVKDLDTDEYVFGGDLNDPEPSGGVVQLSARGWGELTEEIVTRLLLQNAAADEWQTGDEFGYTDGADQISAEVQGDTLLFTVSPQTEFKRGKAGRPDDWKTGLYFWAPGNDLKRIKFTLNKKKGDAAYTLQLVASDGPNDPLVVIDSWGLGGNADITVDKNISSSRRLLGLRIRRTSERKKAKGRRFRISGLKVWGDITQADTYSIDQLIEYLFGLAGITSTDVDVGGADVFPFDELQSSVGDLLDEATSWKSAYWTVYPLAGGVKHGKAGLLGGNTWNITDPHTPIDFIPAKRYNKVAYQYMQHGRERTGIATANPNPFPGESRVYNLDAGEPAGHAIMSDFAQQVADFLATERPTGEGELNTVEDPAAPGVAVWATKVRPGDTLVDLNQGGKSAVVSRKKHNGDGKVVSIELADGDEVLDRIINKRKRLLGQGKKPGTATAGALGIAEPEAPRNVKIRFNQVQKKNGVRRWNIRVKWDPANFDVDDNGAAIRRYVVWIQPHFKAGGGVVPEDQGGGWRKHHVKAHDDDDPNDGNDDCFVTYKNVENARKWKWEAKVKSIDIYGNESAWSTGGYEGEHDGGGPPRPRPGTPISCEVNIQEKSDTVQVSWDSNEDPDEHGDKMLAQDSSWFKVRVEVKQKNNKGEWGNWNFWKQARTRSSQKTFHTGNTDEKRFRAFVWAIDAEGNVSTPASADDGKSEAGGGGGPSPGPSPLPVPPGGTPATPGQPPTLNRAGAEGKKATVTWKYNPAVTPIGVHGHVVELWRVADNEQRFHVHTHPTIYTDQAWSLATHTVEFGQEHINPNKRYVARYYVFNSYGNSGHSPWSGQKLF